MGYAKRREIESLEPREEPPTEVLGWVPVSERLPEEGEPVLVAIRFRHWTDEMPTLIVSSWYEHEDFCGDENDIPYQGVTHWQPLPEPPEVT